MQIGLGDVIRLPFQLAGGAIEGTRAALIKGGVNRSIIRMNGIADPTLYHYTRAFANKHVGIGFHEIIKSGFPKALQDVFGKGGLNKLFEVLTTKLGARGLVLLGAGGFLAAVGVYLGTTLFKESWHKVSKINQGYTVDNVNSAWVHGAHGLTGLAMAVGGVAAFFPPTAIYGAGLAISGLVSSLALHAYRYAAGGNHALRFEETLPWPFSGLVRKYKDGANYN